MPYSFRDRLDHNGRRMKEIHSLKVIIHRPGNDPETLMASPQETIVEEPQDNGMTIRRQLRDYTCDTADYRIAGAVVEPEYGDYILDLCVGLVCRVISPSADSAVFDYITETRKRIRIHTVAIQRLELANIQTITST